MKSAAKQARTGHRVAAPGLRMYFQSPSSAETVPDIALPDNVHQVKKSLRRYGLVGLILFIGTGLTVAIATVPWLDVGKHGFDKWDAFLGIGIAATKASLVAAIFMHLNHERKLVYRIIALGLFTAAGFFIGTLWHFSTVTNDRYFYLPSDHPMGLQSPSPNYAGW